MIDTENLTKGDAVVYSSGHHEEDGTVWRVAERYVFVLFPGSPQPKACDPSTLRRAHGESE